jgi:hypothetical protein
MKRSLDWYTAWRKRNLSTANNKDNENVRRHSFQYILTIVVYQNDLIRYHMQLLCGKSLHQLSADGKDLFLFPKRYTISQSLILKGLSQYSFLEIYFAQMRSTLLFYLILILVLVHADKTTTRKSISHMRTAILAKFVAVNKIRRTKTMYRHRFLCTISV